MSFFRWLISKIFDLLFGRAYGRRANSIAAEKEAEAYSGPSFSRSRDFDADYKAAVRMLRERLDRKYPASEYARLRSGLSTPHDHGEERAQAVDTMSTVIAMALREGATVQQAAEAGAASVGI